MIPGVEKRFCEVDGHHLAYYRAGSGPSVMLVHGITTYSFIWRNLFAELAAEHDVVAVDLLGCGSSDMPLDQSYALKDHAARLHTLATALDLPPYHYVGHDLGGGMGQILAVHHPETLLDLSLLNSVAHDFWPVQPITAMRTPIVRQLLMATMDMGMFEMVVKRGVFNRAKVTSELMDFFKAPFQESRGKKAFLHFARCLNNHNLTEIDQDLQRLDLPVLIVRGSQDLYLGSNISAHLHNTIPGSRLVVIPDAGHFIQEDVPEQLARELLAFFQSGSGHE
jgi:pimeloyl-ACP methyl ester carboxylesterase